MIIGITGSLGAGKGAIVDYLKGKGFSHYSSSDTLKEVLVDRGLTQTRANMSALADELIERHDGGILYVSNEKAVQDTVENYILESIHRESEAAYIRKIGGVVLAVDADMKTRYERAKKRADGEKDNVTFEEFTEDVKREEEGQGEGTPNIRAVINSADYIIENNGTVEELYQQVDEFLKKVL